MKKFICAFFAFLLLFSAAGCSGVKTDTRRCVFKGENGSWAAEYRVNTEETWTDRQGRQDYENRSDSTLTVTFKKALSQLSSVKHLGISYKSGAGGGSSSEDFGGNNPPRKTYVIRSSAQNAAVETEDETIRITISLDGEDQILELKKSG